MILPRKQTGHASQTYRRRIETTQEARAPWVVHQSSAGRGRRLAPHDAASPQRLGLLRRSSLR